MRVRKRVDNLSTTEMEKLLSAVQQLKALPDLRRNYSHFAAIHGRSCPHACELFLPWHRAYIFEYENALRQFEAEVTLPYWDWVGTPSVPAIFAAGPPNPLFYERYTDEQRREIGPHALPAQQDVDRVLGMGNFSDFGGGDADFPYMGSLEQIHGWPHNWVGATMADIGFSACDPIFWSHHANVDRLWFIWQKNHGSDNPSDLRAPLPGLDGNWTVGDVLDTTGSSLGYEYAVDLQEIVVEQNKLTGSPVYKEIRQPASFRRVELRLEGLMSTVRAPMQMSVWVNSNVQATISLFGIHAHHMGGMKNTDPPPSVKPCFEQQEHNNPCGEAFNVRACLPPQSFSGFDSTTRIGLGITGMRRASTAAVMFRRAYLIFQ